MASLSSSRVLALGLSVVGCGDSLVDDSFKGTPIASFQGTVVYDDLTPKHPRAAAFWAPSLEERTLESFLEQVSTSQAIKSGISLTINLFEEPKPLLRWDASDESSPLFGAGRVLAYDDENDNERKDPDEPWLGGMLPFAILYAPQTLPAFKGPSRLDVQAGLHVTWLPWPCEADPEPTGDGDCGTPIGGRCSNPNAPADACQDGMCVDRFLFPWPGGACLVPVEPDGCVPEGGVRLLGQGEAYFARACAATEECMREAPYRCDPVQGACVPFDPPRINVSVRPVAPGFCVDPIGGGMPIPLPMP